MAILSPITSGNEWPLFNPSEPECHCVRLAALGQNANPFCVKNKGKTIKSKIMLEFTITSEFISPLALIVCLAGCVVLCIGFALVTEKKK